MANTMRAGRSKVSGPRAKGSQSSSSSSVYTDKPRLLHAKPPEADSDSQKRPQNDNAPLSLLPDLQTSISYTLSLPFFIMVYLCGYHDLLPSLDAAALPRMVAIGAVLTNACDKCNSRDLSLVTLWLTTLILSVTVFSTFDYTPRPPVPPYMVFSIMSCCLLVFLMVFLSTSLTLQYKWIKVTTPELFTTLITLLSTVTPVMFASTMIILLVPPHLPYVFPILYRVALLICPSKADLHVPILLFTPPLLYLASHEPQLDAHLLLSVSLPLSLYKPRLHLPHTTLLLSKVLILSNLPSLIRQLGLTPSPYTTPLFTGSLLCIIASTYVLDRSALGKHSDDFAQLLIVVGGLLLSVMFGVPLVLSPFAMLTCLALALFVGTRQLRFMLLFAVTTSVTVFSVVYMRIGFLSDSSPSLWRFCIYSVVSVFLLLVSLGCLYRSGSRPTATGASHALYNFAIASLEATAQNYFEYPSAVLFASSAVMTVATLHLYKQRAIGKLALVASLASSIGKLSAQISTSYSLFLTAALLTFSLMFPFAWSQTIIINKVEILRNPASEFDIPSTIKTPFVFHTVFLLPLALYVSSRHFLNSVPTYQLTLILVGCWGLITSGILNHCLPDKGGAKWKSASGVATVVGFGASFFGSASLPLLSMLLLVALLAISTAAPKNNQVAILVSVVFGILSSLLITLQTSTVSSFFFLFTTIVLCMVLCAISCYNGIMLLWGASPPFAAMKYTALTVYILEGIAAELSGFREFNGGGGCDAVLRVAFIGFLSIAVGSMRKIEMAGIRNESVVLAYISGMLWIYGHYGVVGIGENVYTAKMLGVPMSIIGSVLLCALLFIGDEIVDVFVFGVGSLILVGLYVILLRGSPILGFANSGVHVSHESVFQSIYALESGMKRVGEVVLEHSTATRGLAHKEAVKKMAKLAAVGLWTSNGWVGPIVHMLGVACLLPGYISVSLFRLSQRVGKGGWNGDEAIRGLPTLLIPLVLCGNIPHIRLASVMVAAGVCWSVMGAKEHKKVLQKKF